MIGDEQFEAETAGHLGLDDAGDAAVDGDHHGGALRGDLLKDAPGVLARDGEVARGLGRVGAEAEAVVRAPHLASVEAAIAVGVHDRQLRRDTWPMDDPDADQR